MAAARAHAGELATRLSERRRVAARHLESDVEAALHLLELPHARLRVALERRADVDGVDAGGAVVHCGPAGIDDVEFRLATNRGAAPAPLDQGPSGGELSRLVLALAACVTESGSPLLVLDEVDTGIGGETAARVGDLLAATGSHRQVVAVTHRAEIASRATGHLLRAQARHPDGRRGGVGDARWRRSARRDRTAHVRPGHRRGAGARRRAARGGRRDHRQHHGAGSDAPATRAGRPMTTGW